MTPSVIRSVMNCSKRWPSGSRQTFETDDTVARFGGDEFAVSLNDITEPTNAAVVSERILGAIDDGLRRSGGRSGGRRRWYSGK